MHTLVSGVPFRRAQIVQRQLLSAISLSARTFLFLLHLGPVLHYIIRVREHIRDDGHRVPSRGAPGVAIGKWGRGVPSPLLRMHPRRLHIRERLLAHLRHDYSDLACHRSVGDLIVSSATYAACGTKSTFFLVTLMDDCLLFVDV